jgi:hypothetical protein
MPRRTPFGGREADQETKDEPAFLDEVDGGGSRLVLAVSAANATELTVAGDAYVSSAHPATNYGGLTNLYLCNGDIALVQFDLASLPAGTTASQISRATLRALVTRINTAGAVSVQPVTSSWAEPAVTDATIPSLGQALAWFEPTSMQQFVVIDITAIVQGWVTTPSSNHGIALTSASANLCSTPRKTTRPATSPRLT